MARSETLALTVSSGTVQLAVGETAQLQVSPVDGAGVPFTGVMSLVWSSSNARVVSISSSGLVTALSAGAAAVTARATGLDTGAVAAATVQLTVGTSTDVEPPTMPTALSGSATSSTQISLSWTASTDNVGVVGYQVFRNGSLVATPSQTTWQDTGLTASTAYDYAVAAVDGAGLVSPRSGSVRITTLAAPIAVNGLVGAWGLNETTGTNVGDLSGNGHSGTMSGAQWAAGKNQGGLVFSGAGQVLLNDINALDGVAALTVSAWVKTSATGEKHVVDKSRCDGTGVFEFGTSFFTQGRATFLVYQAGASYTYVESAQNVTDGQWHFVAGTFDGTTLRVFDDSYAHLTGFPANQQVDVTIYQGVASAGEVEILLRVNDSPTSVQCYELLYNIQGSAEIVRWNGPLNNFEENPAGTVVYPSPPGAISGDKLRGRVVGSVIEFWFIPSTGPQAGVPHLLATLDDQSSRRVNAGQPGMAFFQRSNSGEPAGSLDFGFADYTAQALP